MKLTNHNIKIDKPKVLKRDKLYSIPCERKNGKYDEITIKVIRDEKYNSDVVFLNNRFMGATLEQLENDRYWFRII